MSVTVGDGRIVNAGPAATGADAIDVGNRTILPGFIDNHVHFITGGLQLERVQLRDATTPGEFTRRIGERARSLGAERWVLGGGWDEQQWDPPRVPTRALLDDVTPQNPVFVTRNDLHMGVANAAALKLAGITRETHDPAGGTIERDEHGEPTGVLKDEAMALVRKVIPPPSFDERLRAAKAGLREAARCGVTSFCDMGLTPEAFDDLRVFQQLERSGELTARVFMYLPVESWELVVRERVQSDRLRVMGVKVFSDGSLGSSTAAFYEPYAGEPSNRGLLMVDELMKERIKRADANGLRLAIHAIGDRAIDEVLSMLDGEDRVRIEHTQHVDASLVRRLARANVIASMQPYHAIDDGRWAESKIGKERAKWAFAWRSLIDAGVRVTFGSDWPVAPLDPLTGIHAATTREWIPEQRITFDEALRCYTSNNAYALFAEHELGTIAPGMRADLVVLSEDRSRVDMTIVGGDVIYER